MQNQDQSKPAKQSGASSEMALGAGRRSMIAPRSNPNGSRKEYVITWEEYKAYQKQYYLTRKDKDTIKGIDIQGNYLLQSPSKKTWRVPRDKTTYSFDTLRPPVFIIDLENSQRRLKSEYKAIVSQAQTIADDCASHFFVSSDSRAGCIKLMDRARAKQRELTLVEDQLKMHQSQRNAEILKYRSEINILQLKLSKLSKDKLDVFSKDTPAAQREYDSLCQEYFRVNASVLLLGEKLDKLEQQTDVLDLFVISEQPKAIAGGIHKSTLVARK